MNLLDRIKRILSGEAKEARASVDDLSARLDADIDRREAELDAPPEQKLDAILDEIATSDSSFDDIQQKLDRGEY